MYEWIDNLYKAVRVRTGRVLHPSLTFFSLSLVPARVQKLCWLMVLMVRRAWRDLERAGEAEKKS